MWYSIGMLIKTFDLKGGQKMKNDKNDMMKTTSLVSSIFSIMTEKDGDLKKKYDQRMRFYIAGSNGLITKPDDWDSLSNEVKKERLDKMDSFGLNQE